MPFTSRVLLVTFILVAFSVQLAYGLESTPVDYYVEPTANDWPDIYYLVFGIGVVAVVLFIMSVMTKPDDLP